MDEALGSDESIKKLEINSKNHCGCRETAVGTHSGGPIFNQRTSQEICVHIYILQTL